MNELFPLSAVTMLSPRLAWLEKHGLETEHVCDEPFESPETGRDITPWVCRSRARRMNGGHFAPNEIGGGMTEDEACADFALAAGIKLWNEEDGIA
jgi:hypothetical protein